MMSNSLAETVEFILGKLCRCTTKVVNSSMVGMLSLRLTCRMCRMLSLSVSASIVKLVWIISIGIVNRYGLLGAFFDEFGERYYTIHITEVDEFVPSTWVRHMALIPRFAFQLQCDDEALTTEKPIHTWTPHDVFM